MIWHCGIYPKTQNIHIPKENYTSIFIVVQIIIAKIWKDPGTPKQNNG